MLHLPRRVIVQLAVFTVIAVGVLAITFLHFVRLPAMLFGVGRYTVTMELVEAGGLYRTGNVTYRGFEVGRVAAVRLTDTGVQAVLALKSGIDIPSDLKAEVHSHTAIGETYVELLPRNAASPPLKNGDVIALADTSVPPDINDLLSAANTALEAIPHENLQTVIDESYTAVAGLGLELSRLIKGSAERLRQPACRRPQPNHPCRRRGACCCSAWSSSSLWRCCCVAGDFASSGHAMRRTSVVTSCKRPGSAR